MSPEWQASIGIRTGEDPIARRAVAGLGTPNLKSLGKTTVHRNGPLRNLRLARTKDLKDDRAGHADFMPIEVDVTPFKRKEIAHPQTSACGQQHERSLSQGQRINQPSYFIWSQDNGDLLPFCTLPREANWIRVADSVPDPMIEEHAHQVPELCAARPGER